MESGFTLDDLSNGLPLLLLILGALILLGLKGSRWRPLAGWAALAVLACAFFWTLSTLEGFRGVNELDPVRQGRVTHIFSEMYLVDTPHLMGHLLILGAALLAASMVLSFLKSKEDHAQGPECLALLLLAPAGGMLMVSGANLMVCFLGFEILSFSLYVLAAIRPQNRAGVEAGLKYCLLGGFAAALFVFGMALIYAGRGSVDLPLFRIQWLVAPPMTGLAGLGATLVFASLLFKASLFPFHMGTPDLHQGAPTPVSALISTITKSAAFVLMLSMATLVPAEIRYALPIIAVASMAVGSLGALRQIDLKRLMAYSAIAHAGFLLVGVNSAMASQNWPDAWQSIRGVYFYLVAYTLANLGTFGLLTWLESQTGAPVRLRTLQGLGARHPWAAALLALFLLSLAGSPLCAGFWARFYLFSQAIRQGFYVLSALGLLLTVVGLFSYLKVIMAMYMEAPEERPPLACPSPLMALPIGLSALGVLLFGLVDPSLLFGFLFGLQI